MTSSTRDLEGKVAIVTGAGGAENIGAAAARALAAAGAKVVLADLATSELESTTRALAAEGLEVVCHAADVGNEDDIRGLIAFTHRQFGRLDVLDNNAAITGNPEDREVMSLSAEVWDRAMRVNARGPMLMCKHALPVMIAGGGGSIINISSGTSVAGGFSSTAYACTKGALNTLTKYVATQYGGQGIRCNALVLGLIMTSALQRVMPAPMQDIFRSHTVIRRLGEPGDVAEMVAFLASDRSKFITGQLLPVDGGFYAHMPTTVEVAALLAVPGK